MIPIDDLRERYEIIAEAANDAIITIDGNGKILTASRAAERIFGYSEDEMIGLPMDRLIPACRKPAKKDAWEISGRHKSGKDIEVELTIGECTKHNKHFYTGIIR